MTRHASCLSFCAQITSGTSQSVYFLALRTHADKRYISVIIIIILTFARAAFSFRLFWFHHKKAISGAVSRCMLLVFLEVKFPHEHLPSASHFHVFFFFQVHLPFCYFELFHTTSLSAMFVYVRVPQIIGSL